MLRTTNSGATTLPISSFFRTAQAQLAPGESAEIVLRGLFGTFEGARYETLPVSGAAVDPYTVTLTNVRLIATRTRPAMQGVGSNALECDRASAAVESFRRGPLFDRLHLAFGSRSMGVSFARTQRNAVDRLMLALAFDSGGR
jgi:hypothetical protein